MAQPTQLNPTEQDALVKQIGLALLRAAPADWLAISVEYRALGRYAEATGRVSFADDRAEELTIAPDIALLFARLRSGMYRDGRGTWYNARYQLDHPSAYNLEYDRDEPSWTTPPPPPAYADDLRTFPRDESNVPDWLMRRMAGLKPPFRVARIFDGTGPTGKPMVNRPPLEDAEREDMLRYLDGAPFALPTRGVDTDHLADEPRQAVPVAFHTDGAWIWPAAVNYYLRAHGVPPDPELQDHIRRVKFTLPDIDEGTRANAAIFLSRGVRRPNGVRPGPEGAAPVPAPRPEQPAPAPASSEAVRSRPPIMGPDGPVPPIAVQVRHPASPTSASDVEPVQTPAFGVPVEAAAVASVESPVEIPQADADPVEVDPVEAPQDTETAPDKDEAEPIDDVLADPDFDDAEDLAIDHLLTRLDELGVREFRYQLGMAGPRAWTMEQTVDGWQVGWFDGNRFPAPVTFDDADDASAFLLGKLLLDTAPVDPGPPTVRASLADLEAAEEAEQAQQPSPPEEPEPEPSPVAEDLFRPTRPAEPFGLFQPHVPVQPETMAAPVPFFDDDDEPDFQGYREAQQARGVPAFGQIPDFGVPLRSRSVEAQGFHPGHEPDFEHVRGFQSEPQAAGMFEPLPEAAVQEQPIEEFQQPQGFHASESPEPEEFQPVEEPAGARAPWQRGQDFESDFQSHGEPDVQVAQEFRPAEEREAGHEPVESQAEEQPSQEIPPGHDEPRLAEDDQHPGFESAPESPEGNDFRHEAQPVQGHSDVEFQQPQGARVNGASRFAADQHPGQAFQPSQEPQPAQGFQQELSSHEPQQAQGFQPEFQPSPESHPVQGFQQQPEFHPGHEPHAAQAFQPEFQPGHEPQPVQGFQRPHEFQPGHEPQAAQGFQQQEFHAGHEPQPVHDVQQEREFQPGHEPQAVQGFQPEFQAGHEPQPAQGFQQRPEPQPRHEPQPVQGFQQQQEFQPGHEPQAAQGFQQQEFHAGHEPQPVHDAQQERESQPGHEPQAAQAFQPEFQPNPEPLPLQGFQPEFQPGHEPHPAQGFQQQELRPDREPQPVHDFQQEQEFQPSQEPVQEPQPTQGYQPHQEPESAVGHEPLDSLPIEDSDPNREPRATHKTTPVRRNPPVQESQEFRAAPNFQAVQEFRPAQNVQPVQEFHPAREPQLAQEQPVQPTPQPVAVRPEPPRRPADWPIQPRPGEPPLTLFRGKVLTELAPGTEIDRYGEPAGNLAYLAGTPFERRSLVPDWVGRPYRAYRVARPTEALTGVAIPWFEQPGGGTAFVLSGSVAELIASGHLVEITDREPPTRP